VTNEASPCRSRALISASPLGVDRRCLGLEPADKHTMKGIRNALNYKSVLGGKRTQRRLPNRYGNGVLKIKTNLMQVKHGTDIRTLLSTCYMKHGKGQKRKV